MYNPFGPMIPSAMMPVSPFVNTTQIIMLATLYHYAHISALGWSVKVVRTKSGPLPATVDIGPSGDVFHFIPSVPIFGIDGYFGTLAFAVPAINRPYLIGAIDGDLLGHTERYQKHRSVWFVRVYIYSCGHVILQELICILLNCFMLFDET
jgi:hypothetical protein